MSKACGTATAGSIHSKVDTEVKTASGKKSALRAVALDGSEQVTVEFLDSVEEIDDSGKKVKSKKKRVEQRNVREAVREFVVADNNAKAAKEQADEAAVALRNFVGPMRDDNAEQGDFHLSFRVDGAKQKSGQVFAVQVSAQDRFSCPKADKEIDVLRELVGSDFFDENFEKVVGIGLKKEVMDNAGIRKDLSGILLKALGPEKLKKYFEKKETWTAKKGLIKNQYELDKDTRDSLRAKCKPAADAVKNASFDPDE